MNQYLEKLKDHLAENEPHYRGISAASIWEMLYWCYTECNPINNEEIRKGFEGLKACTSKLSVEESDQVVYLLCNLCLEHEKAAFFAGLQAGMRLADETRE